MIEREGQLVPPKRPQQKKVQPVQQQPAKPGLSWTFKDLWGAFNAGLRNPGMSYDDWRQNYVPMQQWLQEHPGTTKEDYSRWKRNQGLHRNNTNWLTRSGK